MVRQAHHEIPHREVFFFYIEKLEKPEFAAGNFISNTNGTDYTNFCADAVYSLSSGSYRATSL